MIILSGRFRGKRCVMLKQLPSSGTILVSGPYSVNGVPLRRVNPAYVIATSTKVDISSLSIDDKFDDAYFKAAKPAAAPAKKKDEEGQFFSAEEESAAPAPVSEERKADQAAIDGKLLPLVEKTPMLKEYLGALFTLTSGMKPHEMKW